MTHEGTRNPMALVIPAFNEAATIASVIAWAREFGQVIVVDDASRDATSDLAARAGAQVLRSATNRGYEASLAAGFEAARAIGARYCVTLDADGQHPREAVAAVCEGLRGGADMVVGVRDRRQRLAEHVAAGCSRLLWGIADPFSGLKGYRLESFDAREPFDRHRMVGTELLARCLRRKGRVLQVPISTRERLDAPRFGSSLRANLRLLRALAWMVLVYAGIPS
ncbi:glycosyltransferase family 2 protein [Thiomonas sp.]|uniref:glycosyltransferase family 2 protein n=1 Tax=Thiomonas sp. TaxID=2047785 RepID=UPI0026298A45|nr:glycosyltransferase family 2 protein [Thiomonas sp.]